MPRVDRGMALVLVLIFTVLLYVLVTELVVTARMARLTGENDALVARMHNHMVHTLAQVEEQLRDDLAAAQASGAGGGGDPGSGGGLAGVLGAAAAPAAGAAGDAGAAADQGNDADSSQDAWFEAAGYSDDDITTYVWVEDENRKFNVLTLVSPDREFAEESRRRLVRLIDHLREDSEFDVSSSDSEQIANAIGEWLQGRNRNEQLPRSPLKSDDEQRSDVSLPLHLDELLLVRGVTPDLLFDKIWDGKPVLGLESVLTLYTALKYDPGKPDPNAPPGSAANPAAAPVPPAPGGGPAPETPVGLGINININTAPRAVLRCLFDEGEFPDSVIEAILRYRNEEVEADPQSGDGYTGAAYSGGAGFSDVDLGATVKHKIFAKLEDLEQLPEFANLPRPELKQKFLDLIGVKSDVFSVHMASLYKRSEERRVFVLRRARSVLVRYEDGEEAALYPLILLEERAGVRVMPVDFPEQWSEFDYANQLDEMDEFAREERRWNPFFVEFYRPQQSSRDP